MATEKKTAPVTGGNKGVGLEICGNLANAECAELLGSTMFARWRSMSQGSCSSQSLLGR